MVVDRRIYSAGLALLLVLLFASLSSARDVTLQWDHDGVCDGFIIYRGDSSSTGWPVIAGNVSGEQREFTDFDVPRGNLSWIAIAYTGSQQSTSSNEERFAYYYAVTKLEYDTQGHVLYKGENASVSAMDSDTTWIVSKYYYDAKWNVTQIKVRQGSWIDRVTGW